MNDLKSLALAVILLVSFSCNEKKEAQQENLRIAFLADIHLQDVYGKLQDKRLPWFKKPEEWATCLY